MAQGPTVVLFSRDLRVGGDVPWNYGNWQWVAGTGNDTRPNRTINLQSQGPPVRSRRSYVRRWLAA